MQTLHTPQDAVRWLGQRGAGRLRTDSRQVQRGDAFLAWPGARHDGRLHAAKVLAQGAAACLLEAQGLTGMVEPGTSAMAAYPHLKQASGLIAAAYYEHPSHHLDVVAITGTNGKTSSAWWLAQALTRLGRRCAVVGTLGMGEVQVDAHGLPNVSGPSTGLTTPDAVVFQGALHDFVQAGVKACAVEASSIGLVEHRLEGTRVRVALFTNFTQDHLDYHGSMAAYWQAKLSLFDMEGLQAAAVNLDDPQGVALVAHVVSLAAIDSAAVWTFGESDQARLQARNIQWMPATASAVQTSAGLCFDVVEGAESHRLVTPFVGRYNVSNLLGVLASMRALGIALSDAVAACQGLLAVPGRMQTVAVSGQPLVVVDYAHTPDALRQALLALQPLAQARTGQVHCVIGCGGDRDVGKRPLMAAAAQDHAQQVVLTSDNPRSEDPQQILQHMQAGLRPGSAVQILADRAQAIAHTIAQAAASDIVLIAGKGHEDYQEVAGVRLPFSDVQQARAALQARSAA
jgi:UDP-N-acetylmuramyl-tripeptide synthetase